ncbi:hypothetical protein Fcan01_28363 [Folsomia candida]|uniref:Uncharacterized protein n=1 Tax=Folsomia candida TaxID=158441 RepID=A0A226CVS7_FOLCA|nr:hypothetical protein Fcan01_28363 [Folsomia candida]
MRLGSHPIIYGIAVSWSREVCSLSSSKLLLPTKKHFLGHKSQQHGLNSPSLVEYSTNEELHVIRLDEWDLDLVCSPLSHSDLIRSDVNVNQRRDNSTESVRPSSSHHHHDPHHLVGRETRHILLVDKPTKTRVSSPGWALSHRGNDTHTVFIVYPLGHLVPKPVGNVVWGPTPKNERESGGPTSFRHMEQARGAMACHKEGRKWTIGW